MTKLVRDKYEEKPHEGFTLRPPLNTDEHVHFLRHKIAEELDELNFEEEREGGSVEAGDLIEAVLAYCKIKWGLDEEEISAVRLKKRERLGGFTEGKLWVEG